jgi:uncharacterized membrane protein YgcG
MITSFVSSITYPKLNYHMNDFVGLLTNNDNVALDNQMKLIDNNYDVEMAIVIVNNTQGQDVITYASRLGTENGVGKKDRGIIVLYTTDGQMAIATGRNIGDVFNDAKVGRIVRDSLSVMQTHGYYQGFADVLDKISIELDNKVISTEIDKNFAENKKPVPVSNMMFILIGIFAIIIVTIVAFKLVRRDFGGGI